ncbi:MAG TPA: peptide-methionine (S)-S-oxide reductase MsrA [Candidatus Angelobacter sp.]|nr:peptide-methionine (S)-S-oxide reductase MsrA [Candidatus Angelobacter sp.]
MTPRNLRKITPLVFAAALASVVACRQAHAGSVSPLPAPAVDVPLSKTAGQATAVLSGGCFWGIQAVFEHVKGVISATSGYTGGEASTAHYEMVSDGDTGHAESVSVVYDPSQISYGELLRVFFSVAHDPTEVNRQGPDTGTQYRSMISYANPEQKKIAEAYVQQLNKAKVFSRPIATQVVPLKAFYPAEAYHQDYAAHHPSDPYIYFNDAPKVEHLKKQFPDLYVQALSPK